MANQEACGELVVKEQDWDVDFNAETISFGGEYYPVQFIGSESNSSNTWLWGWENINNFSDSLVALANQTKKTGKAYGLEPLITAEFELTDTFNGHNLSIATCALSDKNLCYYRGQHAGCDIFVAFSNVPNAVFAGADIHRFIKITTECIQHFHIDHKIFIQSFLFQNNTPYEWDNQSIIARFGQDLRMEFEQTGEFLRISNMKTL